MELDEIIVSQATIERFARKFSQALEMDVVIVGTGPSGLVASYYLSKAKAKVTLFERKKSVGGGMWGGGMLFNEIVIQKEAKRIWDEFGISTDERYLGLRTNVSSRNTSKRSDRKGIAQRRIRGFPE